MAKTTTEKGIIDPSVPPEGFLGVYATDDGAVQLVSKHEGIIRTIDFTPEEWDQVAVGGIKMGMIAQAAAQQKTVQIPPVQLSPAMASLIGKAYRESNGKS